MNAIIREITISDLPFFEENKGPMFEESTSLESIKSSLFNRLDSHFLVYETHHILGYIGGYIDGENGEIATLYVLKPYRNQGIAKALIQKFLEDFKNMHGSKITLEVSVNNETAKKLYESFEFKMIHVRNSYYKDGSDALVMLKEIK